MSEATLTVAEMRAMSLAPIPNAEKHPGVWHGPASTFRNRVRELETENARLRDDLARLDRLYPDLARQRRGTER